MDKIRNWSYSRQKLGRLGNDTEQVLKDVIGVYSSHPSGPLSLFARLKSFDENKFYNLDINKRVLRLPAMRLSIHMLPVETAVYVFNATIPAATDPVWEKRYSQNGRGIPIDKYPKWKKQIKQLCRQALTAKEIKKNILIPDELVKAVLNRMSFEGELIRIGSNNLRSNIISYIATDIWAKHYLNKIELIKATSWLAKEYLNAFGPARIRDFKWWAGITSARAARAIADVKTIDLGNEYLILDEHVNEFESIKIIEKDTIDILPQWDCYTMGFAPDGRERIVSPDKQNEIYGNLGATAGNALGTILINKYAHGSWSFRFKGSHMTVSLNLFEKCTAKMKQRISEQFNDIALFLGAKTISLNYN